MTTVRTVVIVVLSPMVFPPSARVRGGRNIDFGNLLNPNPEHVHWVRVGGSRRVNLYNLLSSFDSKCNPWFQTVPVKPLELVFMF